MWEVEAVYSCFIPQDYTSLNTDKDTLYITPLGPPQAREALCCHNEQISSQLLVLSEKIVHASSSRQYGRSEFGSYCRAHYYQEYAAAHERKTIQCYPTCGRTHPPPPRTRQSCSRHKIRTTPLIMGIAVSLKHTERTFHNMFN